MLSLSLSLSSHLEIFRSNKWRNFWISKRSSMRNILHGDAIAKFRSLPRDNSVAGDILFFDTSCDAFLQKVIGYSLRLAELFMRSSELRNALPVLSGGREAVDMRSSRRTFGAGGVDTRRDVTQKYFFISANAPSARATNEVNSFIRWDNAGSVTPWLGRLLMISREMLFHR